MNLIDEVKDNNEDSRSTNPDIKSRRSLYIVGLSYMLSYAGFVGIISIESSMNVKEGLGTASVLVIFLASSFSCVSLVPFIIDYFGAKISIILGEIGLLVYIAANFYPSWFTLIPAAVIYGLFESAPWAGTSVYVTFLGGERFFKKQKRSLTNETKTKEFYVVHFFSQFYSLIYVGDILGCAIVALTFKIFQDTVKDLGRDSQASLNSTAYNEILQTTTTSNFSGGYENSLSLCGANDCQMNYIYNGTDEELRKYKPSVLSVYILLGLFIVLSIGAIIIQEFCLVRAPAKFDTHLDEPTEDSQLDTKIFENIRQKFFLEMKEIFLHLVSPLHLLCFPIVFYYGMSNAFCLTEFTRAYASCILGVEQLGFALVSASISCVLTSAMVSRLMDCFGRRGFMVFVGLVQFATYVLCLVWKPTSYNTWIVYLIGILLGINEALTANLQQGLTALYFEKKIGIAFSVNNFATNLGAVATTGWSTSICVNVQIYILMGSLAFSLLCLAAAEALFQRSKEKEITI